MKNQDNKTLIILAKRLKELRHQQGLTQNELGKKVSITGAMIGHIERANKAPSCFNLKKLAQYFNVTTDYLLGLSNETKSSDEIIDIIIGNKELFNVFHEISKKEHIQKTILSLGEMDSKTLEKIIEIAQIIANKTNEN